MAISSRTSALKTRKILRRQSGSFFNNQYYSTAAMSEFRALSIMADIPSTAPVSPSHTPTPRQIRQSQRQRVECKHDAPIALKFKTIGFFNTFFTQLDSWIFHRKIFVLSLLDLVDITCQSVFIGYPAPVSEYRT